MKKYELTYIFSPDLTLDQTNEKAKEIESFIKSKEGIVLSSEKLSLQTIAYPIKKKSSGYFGGLTFQMAEEKIKELREKLEKDEKILRYITTIKTTARPAKPLRVRMPLIRPNLKVKEYLPFTRTADNKSGIENVSMDDIEKNLDKLLNE